MACGTPEDLILSGAFESFFGKEGIVFDPSTGKLNTKAPVEPIGVEGDFLVSYWVGNAMIRNGFRPSAVKDGQLNINCLDARSSVADPARRRGEGIIRGGGTGRNDKAALGGDG